MLALSSSAAPSVLRRPVDAVEVEIRCGNGTEHDTASARFATSAVRVSGLDHVIEAPVAGDASVTVADRVTVTPIAAARVATPAGATVTAATSPPGTVRWVTIDLASTGSGADRIDARVLLLGGSTPDGTGTRLAHNDDIGYANGRYNFDSRIVRRFLQPGRYTIEATTFRPC